MSAKPIDGPYHVRDAPGSGSPDGVSFLDDIVRPELADVRPYLPHQGDFRIRLDANEAPGLFPASIRERLTRAFGELSLERYPDATATSLRRAIAARLGVEPDEVLLGVGSDEILALLVTALAKPRRAAEPPIVLTTSPTFVMYRMSARLRGLRVIEVPLDASWDLAEESMLRALELGPPHLVFIASPNNPTGTSMDRGRLERVIQAAPRSLVVVDEAYIDYADRSQLDLFRSYENVAILRTLSKVGFASLRVGWLVGKKELVRELDKVRLPYNTTGVSQALAALVVGELWNDVLGVVETVKAERARLAEAFARFPGVQLSPSQANFLWVRTPGPAEGLFRALGERGILVRSFHEAGGRLAQQLRITVGSPAENEELVRAWRELA
jgi:histidinol-phosphate aminotransferase